MQRDKLINKIVANYKQTLNQNSKWFSQDVQEFRKNLSVLSVKELIEKLARLSYYNSQTFERQANREINTLDKAGMYNLNLK
jgi:hypothetical protein